MLRVSTTTCLGKIQLLEDEQLEDLFIAFFLLECLINSAPFMGKEKRGTPICGFSLTLTLAHTLKKIFFLKLFSSFEVSDHNCIGQVFKS